LGASDEQIIELSKIYWFTSEIGLTLEGNQRKAFGGAVLSSLSELANAMSEKPQIRRFDVKDI